ncbi:peptidase U32 family protein [Slackia isoflavoniconvertens]|uniref:peptidase U32 family protein n=1 Tax=Slackia isoflavoniconvertens TaxID=572010 RepID=UPI003A974ACB
MITSLKHTCAGMARPMELLAPAGGMEQLECAVHFGADAVYLAGKRFGMRRRASNFDDAGIASAVKFAHEHGVKVFVTANTLMKDGDVAALPDFFAMLQDAGVDAAIVSDMGALSICRRTAPKLELHLSTQASCMNAEAAKAYYDLGVSRVVVAREMSLSDIARMRESIPDDLEIEAFVHGAMCMAYSGRCLMSDYMVSPSRGANNGHCAQPCRWKYTVVEETRPGEPFSVIEEDGGSFIMSSTDMNMLSHVRELSEAGVDSIKIEGRAKGAYYVASAVNAYRHVLDGEPADAWQAELETTSHRPYSTGFYFGAPGQNQGVKEYARDYQMVARVVSCGKNAPSLAASESADGALLSFPRSVAADQAVVTDPAVAAGVVASDRLDAASRAGASSRRAAEIQPWPEAGIAARRQAIASDPYAEKKGCVSLSFIDGLAASPAQTHRAVVMCRNRFFEGETLEVLSPGRGVFTIQPTRLVWHAADDASPDDVERRREGVLAGADPRVAGGTLCAVNVANRTMETYSFDCGEELRAGDILRVLRTDQCEGRTIE